MFTRSQVRSTSAGMLLVLAGCGPKQPAAPTTPPPANVGRENIAVVDTGVVEKGPALSGTLAPEREAQLRAQVGGAVVSLPFDAGTAVHAGEVVAVIDTMGLGDAVRSALSQLTSATLAADVARRNYERSQALHAGGAIADRDLETAHNQSVAADAALADSKAHVTAAERQLSNAIVRAPFAGVVSERPASMGDVMSVGGALLTIVDPTALQLEASVPADDAATVKIGAKAEFAITGATGHGFTGRVARINPSVDPATRQVRLYVSVPNPDRALATGSFAEGRIAVTSARALTIPLGALDTKAAVPSVKRLRGGVVESVPVTLGVRDDVAERVEVTRGLAFGDTLLVGPVLSTPVGTAVRVSGVNR